MLHPRSKISLTLSFVVLIVFGCQAKELPLPTRTSSPGGEILNELNIPFFTELDALECPAEHPGYLVHGETYAYNEMYKKELRNLGLRVRWDCEKKLYEIVPDEQSSAPICGCQLDETTSPVTTLSLSDIAFINLNDWNSEELDKFECRADHPDNIPTVLTNEHVEIFKQRVQDFGLEVRWNCEKKLYEIVPNGENTSPICGCQSLETPLPTTPPFP